MKIICTTCNYEYDDKVDKKCPRCGSAAPVKSGCESCSGCSFWKACKVKQDCSNMANYESRK